MKTRPKRREAALHVLKQAEPKPTAAAAIRSEFLKKVLGIRSELAAVENSAVKEIEKLFIRIGLEVGQIVKREYDEKQAKINPLAMTKKLQRLAEKKIDELVREFQKRFKRDLENTNKLGDQAVDELLKVQGEKKVKR